jgi:GNAT superfamily N-acetyltransferase
MTGAGGQRTGEVRIRLLAPEDDRSQFACGDIELDRFFQLYAGQNQFRHHIGSTYIALSVDTIAGFVTVSPGEMTAEAVAAVLKKKLPAYPIPILRIARLAVDARFQGRGIGKLMLRAVFELALELRDRIGCSGVVADAKPGAVSFYQRLGFLPLEAARGSLAARPEPLPMFLPVKLIEKAKESRVITFEEPGAPCPALPVQQTHRE